MKKIFKKNQVMVTALALMLAVAGYFSFMNENSITGLPLVDDNKKFKGYVSLKEIAAEMIYNEKIHVDTAFDHIARILDATETIKFDEHIQGFAHAATFDDDTFVKDIKLDDKSIVLIIKYENNNLIKNTFKV